MNETRERPRFRVRRDAVLVQIPEDIPRTSPGLAEFFGISRSTAWRLFLADDAKDIPQLGRDSIAAICAALPKATFEQLFESEGVERAA